MSQYQYLIRGSTEADRYVTIKFHLLGTAEKMTDRKTDSPAQDSSAASIRSKMQLKSIVK
jgi:formate-dependent phosphoribosylglycinamide formyltransferase (GAR transformylase)